MAVLARPRMNKNGRAVTITDSMTETVSPAPNVSGAISVPGDKSISHRFAMLTSIAEGESHVLNYSTGADCQSTLSCMAQLGIRYEFGEHDGRKELIVHGKGIHGLTHASEPLDAGNSGSTIRMLSGILSAQPFAAAIFGDESLSRRPMRRIMTPLRQMGAAMRRRTNSIRRLPSPVGHCAAFTTSRPSPAHR